MHVTTMRFDDDVWTKVKAEADRLGVSCAEYLRGMLAQQIGYQAGLRARGELEARVDVLDGAVRRIVAHLTARDARAVGGGLRSG